MRAREPPARRRGHNACEQQPFSSVSARRVTVSVRHISVRRCRVDICHAGTARLPRRHGTFATPAWHVCHAGVANHYAACRDGNHRRHNGFVPAPYGWWAYGATKQGLHRRAERAMQPLVVRAACAQACRREVSGAGWGSSPLRCRGRARRWSCRRPTGS